MWSGLIIHALRYSTDSLGSVVGFFLLSIPFPFVHGLDEEDDADEREETLELEMETDLAHFPPFNSSSITLGSWILVDSMLSVVERGSLSA